MDSSGDNRRPGALGRPAILVIMGVLATAAAPLGCRSAAAVFLDLPPASSGPQGSPSQEARAAERASAPSTPLIQDTVREVPPIERATSPDSILALLPKAPDGSVDWAEAIRSGAVTPRPGPSKPPSEGTASFGYDFYFGAFEALFPHSAHVAWMDCGACHPAIYRTRSQGSTLTSMAAISNGESCGVCHGPVAFSADVCERCHQELAMPEGRLEPSLGPTVRIARDSTVTSTYPRSVFSHAVHRIRYRCTACHTEPYPFEQGVGSARMADLQDGKGCGTCHDGKVAFGLGDCGRCHVSEDAVGH